MKKYQFLYWTKGRHKNKHMKVKYVEGINPKDAARNFLLLFIPNLSKVDYEIKTPKGKFVNISHFPGFENYI